MCAHTVTAIQREEVQILVIEDNPDDARLLRRYLEKSTLPRFVMTHVETIGAAIAHASSTRFDLALLDLGLPDARELEGLDSLRVAVPALPLVVVTGQDDEELAADALHRGAEDYLPKGAFDRRLLLRTIRYAIERNRGRRDLEEVSRELKDVNRRLESLLVVDPLTELLNRRGVEQALDHALDRIGRERIEHLAFFIDLDHFKKINDRYGHAVGDVVLAEVAGKLKETARAADFVGRLGGDEFVILMPGARTDEMLSIAERIRLAVRSTFVGSGSAMIHVTACVAAMRLTRELRSIDLLLGRMHALLHRAKSSRDCVALEGVTEEESHTASDSICDDVRRGEGIYAVAQPIIRLSDLSVSGYEMLSRFRNGSAEGPDAVFRICAERNMLALADHRCLSTCIGFSRNLPADLSRHVNIFPSTLMGMPVQHLLELFPRENRGMYCVELSEQQMLGETRRLQERVEMLREAGLRIACDDVGFGRSQLESLVLLEPDVIKLDKRCVRGISVEKRARRQTERFISVAQKLGAEIVAEGIETEEDLRVLRELGVDFGQGYLWGVPSIVVEPRMAS